MAKENGIFTLAAPRDIENLEECHFYHTLDLPGFGTVEGEWDLRGRFDDYVGGVDLRGKTVLAIAYRLSTIAELDRLIVLDAGRIIEQGRHDELIARGGLYARLWRRQSGGFLAVEDSQSRRVG